MDNQLKLANSNNARLGIAIAIFFLAFAYPTYQFFSVQALFPEYQAFPLVIAAILAILYFRLKETEFYKEPVSDTKRKYSIVAIVAGSIILSLCLVLALQIRSYRLATIVLVAYLALLVLVTKLHYRIPGIWYIWALSILLVLRLSGRFVSSLQIWSSWISSQILEVFGILHVMRGNTLELPGRQLFVDEACSGIVSLITIISAVSLYCVWMRRSLAHSTMMLVLGGMWTVFMNTVRIVTIAVALEWWQVDLSEGMPHTLLGVALFVVSLGVLKLVDMVLFEFFRPIDASVATDGDQKTAGYYLMTFWDRWFVNEGAERWSRGEMLYGGYGDDIDMGRKRNTSAVSPEVQNAAFKEATAGFKSDVSYLLSWPVLAILLASVGFQIYLIRFEKDTNQLMAQTRQHANQFSATSSLVKADGYELAKFDSHTNEKRKDWWGEESRIWIYKAPSGAQLIFSLDFPFGPEFHDLSGCYRGAGWSISNYRIINSRDSNDPWVLSSFDITNESGTQTVYFTAFTPDGKPAQRSDFLSGIGISRGFLDVGAHYQVQILTDATPEQLSREQGDRLLEDAAKYIRDTICATSSSPQVVSQN